MGGFSKRVICQVCQLLRIPFLLFLGLCKTKAWTNFDYTSYDMFPCKNMAFEEHFDTAPHLRVPFPPPPQKKNLLVMVAREKKCLILRK